MLKRLVDRLALRFGFLPVRKVQESRDTLRRLAQYADRSGHLANGYKAGKRVKADVSQALANLHGATAALPAPKERVA